MFEKMSKPTRLLVGGAALLGALSSGEANKAFAEGTSDNVKIEKTTDKMKEDFFNLEKPTGQSSATSIVGIEKIPGGLDINPNAAEKVGTRGINEEALQQESEYDSNNFIKRGGENTQSRSIGGVDFKKFQ